MQHPRFMQPQLSIDDSDSGCGGEMHRYVRTPLLQDDSAVEDVPYAP